MKRAGLVLVVLLATPALAAAETVIASSNQSVDHDCGKDPELVINGSSHELAVTGECTRIVINGSAVHGTIASVLKLQVVGSGNELAVDAADRIALVGSDNKVTYKRSVTPKKKTRVGNVGTGNRIKRVK